MTSLRTVGLLTLLIASGPALAADFDFTAPAHVDPNGTTDIEFDTGAAVAASANSWVAVWETADNLAPQDWDVYRAHSSDGGATWTGPFALGGGPGADEGRASQIRVAASRSGTWVAVWTLLGPVPLVTTSVMELVFSRSTDDGLTWSAVQNLDPTPGPGTARLRNTPQQLSLATDGGGIWIAVWNEHTGGSNHEVFLSRSDDDGATWSVPARADPNPAQGSAIRQWSPRLATDRRGNWLLTWVRGPMSNEGLIEGVRSDNDGADWSAPEPWYEPEMRLRGQVRLATDGCGVWVLVWSECAWDSPCSAWRLLASKSVDLGATWSGSVPVTDPGHFSEGGFATDRRGNWVIAWTPTGPPGDVHFEAARSADNGASWEDQTSLPSGGPAEWPGAPSLASDESERWVAAWSAKIPFNRNRDIFASTTEIAAPEPRRCWRYVWIRTPHRGYVLRRIPVRCRPRACSVPKRRPPGWWSHAAAGIYGEWLALPHDPRLDQLTVSTEQMVGWLASVPEGDVLTKKRKASLSEQLREAAYERSTERLEPVVEQVVNAIELDRWVQRPSMHRVEGGAPATVELGALGRVTLATVARGGRLSSRHESGVPAVFEGYSPGFPMATYELKFEGRLAKGSEAKLEFELNRISFWRPLETLKLLEWDGERYRDVTESVDVERGVIRGRTNRLASYVIMQPEFLEDDAIPPRCGWWQRIRGTCREELR